MLVITRRPGERVFIGEGDQRIELVVIETRRRSVRMAIAAPEGTVIQRAELADEPRKPTGR